MSNATATLATEVRTHIRYRVKLPGHYSLGYCLATFEQAAWLWNGGNSVSENKMADPVFREKVEAGLKRIAKGHVISVCAADLDGITEAEYKRANGG